MICTTCNKPAARPFRVYGPEGRVLHGCIDACHEPHLVSGTESSRWHHRPIAKAHRRAEARRRKRSRS